MLFSYSIGVSHGEYCRLFCTLNMMDLEKASIFLLKNDFEDALEWRVNDHRLHQFGTRKYGDVSEKSGASQRHTT